MGENDPEIPATCFLSLCQTANILTLIPLFVSIKLNNWLIIVLILSFITFNGFYSFSSKRVARFENKWKNETKTRKYIGGGVVILYIVASAVLYCCSFGYYEEYTNWKWDI